MEVTLAPTLTTLQKSLLRDWLQVTLNDDGLNSTRPYPLHSAISLYIDGSPRKLQSGTWIVTTDHIYLAKPDQDCPMSERLPILLTLSQLCEPSEELTKACSGAITRYLLGEYRSLSTNLVVSSVPPSGIAFSCDNRVASLLGTEWMLPSGEVVDVSGPDWVVCASEVPVAPVQEVAVDTQFSAAPFGPAFPPTQDESTTRQFRVGDRVSYTQIPGVVRTPDFYETGVVELANYDEGRVIVRSDQTMNTWAFGNHTHLLTLIEPPIDSEYQFSVGQRVHWSNTTYGPQDGVIESLPTPARDWYDIRDDQNRIWAARVSELEAL